MAAQRARLMHRGLLPSSPVLASVWPWPHAPTSRRSLVGPGPGPGSSVCLPCALAPTLRKQGHGGSTCCTKAQPLGHQPVVYGPNCNAV